MTTKTELEQALKDSDEQVNSLENDVDYYIAEIEELEGKIEELEGKIEELEEGAENSKTEMSIKDLKIMLCDRYGLNHFTEWSTLVFKLIGEYSR